MADKSVTIKGATDKELNDLLVRLRKECEVQNLVAELKRKSMPNVPMCNEEFSYSRPEISTDKPIESLYHYGVPGMRWGVRRRRGAGGRDDEKKKQPASEDHMQARIMRAKGARALSTKELKDFTQRIQLEKQFKDLNPSEYKKGMEVVKGLVAAGTTVASLYGLSKTPLGQDIIKAVKSHSGGTTP